MQQYIEVEIKNKYGNELIYPVDQQAVNFCRLLGGQKTLTLTNIEHIKTLGFEVKVKQGKVAL